MKKVISTCFGTTKKAIVSTVCIAAAVAVIGGAAYAATSPTGGVANTSVIGESLAQNYAFADAGVDPASATNILTEYDYEDGQFIYDVEFTADDTEYEYWIRATDGAVIRKSADIINPVSADAGTTADEAATTDTGNAADAVSAESTTDANVAVDTGSTGTAASTGSTSGSVSSGSGTGSTAASTATSEISLDRAKEIALADAGVSASDVTYTKTKRDTDDGVAVYDIEFYTASTEYDYEIRVSDGAITDRSQEAFQTSGSQASAAASSSS
ncbi:MAG: PepSY domain-containing protein [Clostridiales bacterium]|nr:PepSY domain-containing protein [Clostridiales bacterium]